MGILVGVASTGFTGRVYLQKSNWLGSDGFEGMRETAWRANMVPGAPSSPNLRRVGGKIVPIQQNHYTMWLRIVNGILTRLFAAG